LHQVIASDQELSPKHVQFFIFQILRGVKHMHAAQVLHRDLKPSNILVMGDGTQAGTVKICDFGLARIFQSPLCEIHRNGVVVTIWYRAPEILLVSRHYTRAIDIWAIGCIFAELLNNNAIFQGNEDPDPLKLQLDQLDKIIDVLGPITPDKWPDVSHSQYYPQIRDLYSQRSNENRLRSKIRLPDPTVSNWKGFDLLLKMLDYNPSERITANNALDHPYFKDAIFSTTNALSYVTLNLQSPS